MAQVPIAPEYFTVPEPGADDPRPRLLGSRCPACGEHFYPRRMVCAKCLHEGCEDVVLSPTGTLWTYTYVHVPLFAKKDAVVERLRRGPGRPARGPAHPGDPRGRARRLRDRHGPRARPRDAAARTRTATTW